MTLDELCIHKDIQRTKEFCHREFGIPYDMVKAPLTYCEKCDGSHTKCFYYHRLKDIKRMEDEIKNR